MRSPGINREGELRGQPANPGSPGKMAVKMEYVCVQHLVHLRNGHTKRNNQVQKRAV